MRGWSAKTYCQCIARLNRLLLDSLTSLNGYCTPTLRGPAETSAPGGAALLFFIALLAMIVSWSSSLLCSRSRIDSLVIAACSQERRSLWARICNNIDSVARSCTTATAVNGRGEIFLAHFRYQKTAREEASVGK